MSQKYHITLPLESGDKSFIQKESENLWKQSAGEVIRRSVYDYQERKYQKKQAWYCGSSSYSFDGGDKETMSTMESKIIFLNVEIDVVADRERKKEVEIVASKEARTRSMQRFRTN